MSKNQKAFVVTLGGWYLGILLLINIPAKLSIIVLVYGVLWLWAINHFVKKDNPIPFVDSKNNKSD